MVRSMRKYNKWFMAIGGAVLMVAWLIGPSSQKLADMHRNRVVAKLDGHGITAAEQAQASKELQALASLDPGLVSNLGIQDRDATHWLLLTHEAESAGFVGGPEDGKQFADDLARALVQQQMYRDFRMMMEIQQSKNPTEAIQELVDRYKTQIPMYLSREGLNSDEANTMLARAQGVIRLVRQYQTAARVSDRLAAVEARRDRDAAIADYVFVPASLSADKIPTPDDAALRAFFDTYKTVKPGEGEYGVGYLFPPRVKLEWLTLNRKAFESAVKLDPVEVRKRYMENHPGKFPGDFAAERASVEKEMIAEAADKAMSDAQLAIHAAILRVTKALDNEGKYKVLPATWEQERPKLDAIARAVQAQEKQAGVDIGVPEVTERTEQWTTLDELAALPGIGGSSLHQGGFAIPLSNVVGWTRELPGVKPEQTLVPIQTGVTLAENPLQDQEGNRYFVTILATRGESAPDRMEDIKDRVTQDYKDVQAFEALKGRADELRQLALNNGLEAVVTAVDPTSTPPPDQKDAKDTKPKVQVRNKVSITRERSGGDPSLDDPALRSALIAAAEQIDPHTEWGKADPSKAFVAIPTSKHLGVAVFHILSNSPVTEETYRAADASIVNQRQIKELKLEDEASVSPFSMASLLKRHKYVSGDKVITSPDDLKKEKGEG